MQADAGRARRARRRQPPARRRGRGRAQRPCRRRRARDSRARLRPPSRSCSHRPPPDVVAGARRVAAATGSPLRVGRVGDQLVAAELADHGIAGAGWAKPDGVAEAGKLRLFPGATPAGLVLAGCDPALGVAEAMLHGLGPRSLLAISAPTGTALEPLDAGQRARSRRARISSTSCRRPPVPVVRWHLARWQVGLAIAPNLKRQSLEALLHGKVPIAQRDPAAASQQAFARAAAKAGFASPPPGPRSRRSHRRRTNRRDARLRRAHDRSGRPMPSTFRSSPSRTTPSRSGSPSGGPTIPQRTPSETSWPVLPSRNASPSSAATTSPIVGHGCNRRLGRSESLRSD